MTEKAKILDFKTKLSVVECQFNPNEYTVQKQNSWTHKPEPGANIGKTEFGGGQPATLTLKLFFDTSEKGTDVRDETNKVWELMRVKPGEREPSQCMFCWGKPAFEGGALKGYFQAIITKISQQFNLFLGDGTPVRATLDVTFQQYQDANIFPPQNPTSRSEARKVWVVHAGQTLDWIAYQEYGDPNQWRHIAATNDLADPRRLRPGQVLNLVPLP